MRRMSSTSKISTGFEECVIVPLELYKEAKRSREDKIKPSDTEVQTNILQKRPEDILTDKSGIIPADLKFKLYSQARKQQQRTSSHTSPTTRQEDGSIGKKTTEGETFLIGSIPSYARTTAKRIIEEYINTHRHIVSWNPNTLEIIIDDKVQRDTNINRIFRYLLLDDLDREKSLPPNGAELFRSKLITIGVPEAWLHEISQTETSTIGATGTTSPTQISKSRKSSGRSLFTNVSPVLRKKSYFLPDDEETDEDEVDDEVIINQRPFDPSTMSTDDWKSYTPSTTRSSEEGRPVIAEASSTTGGKRSTESLTAPRKEYETRSSVDASWKPYSTNDKD